MLSCSVIGNLGADAELKYTPTGQPMLSVNVAANQRQKVDGEWRDSTEWCRITVFGARAESIHPHLLKGTRVYASGRLTCRPWTDRGGALKAGLELVADTVEFMTNRQDAQRPGVDDLDGAF
jgi:single-strand DNA-binding protein